MPSEQATAAAEEIVNGDGKWESDPKQVKRVAKIIDAAFAPVVAELKRLKQANEVNSDVLTEFARIGQ